MTALQRVNNVAPDVLLDPRSDGVHIRITDVSQGEQLACGNDGLVSLG
jgi:hypothetical protein